MDSFLIGHPLLYYVLLIIYRHKLVSNANQYWYYLFTDCVKQSRASLIIWVTPYLLRMIAASDTTQYLILIWTNNHIVTGTLIWTNGHMRRTWAVAGRAAGWGGLKWAAMSWDWCEPSWQDGCVLGLWAGNHRFEASLCSTFFHVEAGLCSTFFHVREKISNFLSNFASWKPPVWGRPVLDFFSCWGRPVLNFFSVIPDCPALVHKMGQRTKFLLLPVHKSTIHFTDSATAWCLVTEANSYAHANASSRPHSKAWNDVSIDEMKTFMGILILLGIIKLLWLEMFWQNSNEYIRTHIMSRNGFAHFLFLSAHVTLVMTNLQSYTLATLLGRC